MSDSHDELDVLEEPNEDGNLTIRIPNPKVYMARQSSWIGRRGKPRCDHCRMNNLKCDRILPTCNHCSWTPGRECIYTPLPTPAHRGIPRCDRCRRKNLKCDRNLPICNHCGHDQTIGCNYTPKKRHKVHLAHTGALQTSEDGNKMGGSNTLPELSGGNSNDRCLKQRNSYSTSTASPPRRSPSPIPCNLETLEIASSLIMQTGRFAAESSLPIHPKSSLPSIAPKAYVLEHSSYRAITVGSQVEPWAHPSFAPLPAFINQRLGTLNSTEIPDRPTFDRSLTSFLDGLMEAYRETACLTPGMYAAVSRSLSKHETSELAATIRDWVAIHHLCSGSDKLNLILSPREAIFQAEKSARETCRLEYCARAIDRQAPYLGSPEFPDRFPPSVNLAVRDNCETFDRLPVRSQIYDILAYAHASHNNPYMMVQEIKQLGFAGVTWPMAELYIQLCPICSSS